MFRLFLAIFRSNKEPEFRYTKCAPNGINIFTYRIRCSFYIPELWFLIGPEDG